MSDNTTRNLPDDRIDTLVVLVQTMSTDLQDVRTDLRDVKARLGTLEQTVGERLYDTRPIWERALAEIADTRSEMGEVRSEIREVRSEMREVRSEIAEMRSEMKDGFKKVSVKMDLLNRDILEVRAENESLVRRVDKLESNSS